MCVCSGARAPAKPLNVLLLRSGDLGERWLLMVGAGAMCFCFTKCSEGCGVPPFPSAALGAAWNNGAALHDNIPKMCTDRCSFCLRARALALHHPQSHFSVLSPEALQLLLANGLCSEHIHWGLAAPHCAGWRWGHPGSWCWCWDPA